MTEETDNLDLDLGGGEEEKTPAPIEIEPLKFAANIGKTLPMFYRYETPEIITFANNEDPIIGQKLQGSIIDADVCEVVEILEKRAAAGEWNIGKYHLPEPQKMDRPSFYRVRVKNTYFKPEEVSPQEK